MIRQSEFKKKYDPDTGKYTQKHIYGEGNASRTGGGVLDTVKSFLGKKQTRKKVTFAPSPKPTPTATKKAGDKIVKMLSDENPTPSHKKKSPMSQQEINNKVLQILYGSGRKKLI